MSISTITRRGTLPAALGFLLLLGACAEPEADTGPEPAIGHVHGLGVNPGDDRLHVATHFGLYVLDDGELRRVGHDTHDLMGFTVVGEDRFLASGHPVGGDLPEPMGLVRSDDGGLTWEPVSLTGRADLHGLDADGDDLAAYDSFSGRVLTSTDAGRTFETVGEVEALDVALTGGGDVAVAGADGVLRLMGGAGEERLGDAPGLVTIDRVPGGLVGLGPDGRVWVSSDARSWTGRGQVDGVPAAFTVDGDRWYSASSTGLYVSDDEGASWRDAS
ncbi:hypothetical protein [Aeromicrobium sp. CTD01-1L150]|uniref:sialidase family protein n=1 Tax=Aeromicrobium sp. CTD01-1L150 TaxID=3341830 RepID=UPI0035BF30F8